MKKTLLILPMSMLMLLGTSSARAEVLFTDWTSLTQVGSGYLSLSNITTPVTSYQALANPFSTTDTATLTSIDVVMDTRGGAPITLALASDSNGLPGSVLESWSLTLSGNTNALYSVTSLLNPVLTAGTTYWLEALPGANDNSGWGVTSFGHTIAVSHSAGIWTATTNEWESAFDVNGTAASATPEPSTFAMFGGAGLLAITLRNRQRKTK